MAIATSRDPAREAALARNVPLADYYRGQGAPLPDWPVGDRHGFDEIGRGRASAGTPGHCIRAIERCRDELGAR